MNKYKRLTKHCEVGIGLNKHSTDITESYTDVITRLCELEDKIEAGTMIEPPVKLGQEVWYIPHYNGKPYCGVCKDIIRMIGFSSRGFQVRLRDASDRQKTYMLGKSVFTTKEAAKEQLRKEEDAIKENSKKESC